MSPKISIIIPVFNSSKTLVKCIKSIINQSFVDFEAIFVNDCSTDNSLEILNQYVKLDNRIKIINSLIKLQTLKARIEAIKNAKGKFITFLDSDDWMHKNGLKVLYENALITNSDVVLGSWIRVFDDYGLIRYRPTNLYYSKLIKGDFNIKEIDEKFNLSFFGKLSLPVVNWSKLYKKELFENFINTPFPNMVKANDIYLNILVFNNVNKITFIKDVIIYYRDGGISQKIDTNYLENVNELYLLRKEFLKNNINKDIAYEYINKELDYTYYTYLNQCLTKKNETIEEIYNRYLIFKEYQSFKELIYYKKKYSLNYFSNDLFDLLENKQLKEAFKNLNNISKKIKIKRYVFDKLRGLIKLINKLFKYGKSID